jgi:putative chitinase
MINKLRFFSAFRDAFGPLDQQQVDGLDFLLDCFGSNKRWADLRHVAYALATAYHETGHTFQPIEERGGRVYLSKYYLRKKLRADLGNIQLSDAWVYKGRGYVQITGRRNYSKFSGLVVKPLLTHPELALDHDTAFDIMTEGMFGGHFTGVAITRYVNASFTDYVNARKVINGLDRADVIAGMAAKFEQILRGATV